jgi:hypothetical protein
MRLLTDFNYRENPNRVWADLEDAESPYLQSDVRIGKVAELHDGLGNQCMGTIVAVESDNGMVELELDRSTWRSTRRPNREFDYPARRSSAALKEVPTTA